MEASIFKADKIVKCSRNGRNTSNDTDNNAQSSKLQMQQYCHGSSHRDHSRCWPKKCAKLHGTKARWPLLEATNICGKQYIHDILLLCKKYIESTNN